MIAIVTCILNALDALFTLYLVNKYDIDIELNPVGKWLIASKYGLIIQKIIVVSLLVVLLYTLKTKYPLARYALLFLLIVFSLLTVYHLIIFIIQEFINP